MREKLQIWDAVIRSKLMYGIESAALNTSVLKKIDAFQMKTLRTILGKQTTYYNRVYSNEYLIREANLQLSETHEKEVQRLSVYHKERRMVLLAKLLTLGEKEPSAKVTFVGKSLKDCDLRGIRRAGRPRLNWFEVTLKDFWERAKEKHGDGRCFGDLETSNQDHLTCIYKLAEYYDRKHKFSMNLDPNIGPPPPCAQNNE